MPQHADGGTALKSRSFWLGMARPPLAVSFSFTRRASSKVNAPLQHEHGMRVWGFCNPQWTSCWAASKGRLKFRIALVWRSLNFIWKALTPSQSHCNGSGYILKTRWDSGYGPIIIPATYCYLLSAFSWERVFQKSEIRPFAKNSFGLVTLSDVGSLTWSEGKRWETNY